MALNSAFRQIIAQFRDSRNWDEELDLKLLQALWPGIVGKALADNTSVVAIEDGVAVVRVPDRIWRQQLLALGPLLLKKINEPWPGRGIRQIRFVYENHD